jgi:hypothetical protein
MGVASLYPTREVFARIAPVGRDNHTGRIRHPMGKQQFGHRLPDAIVYPISRIDDQTPFVLLMLQLAEGSGIAGHIKNDITFYVGGNIFLFRTSMNFAPQPAQFLHYLIKYSGIVAHMIGRIFVSSADTYYIYFLHFFFLNTETRRHKVLFS